MDWTTSVKEIQKFNDNNRLVLFVGAGVSANSEILTWPELIDTIATKINYKKTDLDGKHSPDREYTPDEYLKIPEYFYNTDKTKTKKHYYEFIKNALSTSTASNDIDKIILEVLPHHIITTNYDELLENADSVNTKLYSVIKSDKDLLANTNSHYIIKMHGDIHNPQDIVLKEKDYLEYEQRHPLICNYIKSLLIDHSFLFVGYSLNDYNLKLIMGWINYFSEEHGIKQRPHNFIVGNKAIDSFEIESLEHKGIFYINSLNVPLESINVAPHSLTNKGAKHLYTYLKCIQDKTLFQNFLPLKELLINAYETLTPYNYISNIDLKKAFDFGRIEFKADSLIIYDEEIAKEFVKLLECETEANSIIIQTLLKARIQEVSDFKGKYRKILPYKDFSPNFKKYLDNDYQSVELDKINSTSEKAYYYFLFNKEHSRIESLFSEMDRTQKKEDFIPILQHKINCHLYRSLKNLMVGNRNNDVYLLMDTLPNNIKNSIHQYKTLIDSDASDKSKMADLLDVQERRHFRHDNESSTGHAHIKIWALQAYAYDYYFFIKENFVMMDYLANPKDYFRYYLQAILCSYYLISSKDADDYFMHWVTAVEPYSLGEVEVDMFIKYTKPKMFNEWLIKYSVDNLLLCENVNIVYKFDNYCKSYSKYKNQYWEQQLECFMILISKLSLSDSDTNSIVKSFILFVKQSLINRGLFSFYFKTLRLFIWEILPTASIDYTNEMLNLILLNYEMFDSDQYNFFRTLQKLAYNKEINNVTLAEQIIDDEHNPKTKCSLICALRNIINMSHYVLFLQDNITQIFDKDLFTFAHEKLFPDLELIENEYVKRIEQAELEQIRGVSFYPDSLKSLLDRYTLLNLIGRPIDLEKIKKFSAYSDVLEFMLNPENFDYSKVNPKDYRWQNLIANKKYRQYFQKNSIAILTEELLKRLENNLASVTEQKIVYGFLLDKDDIM